MEEIQPLVSSSVGWDPTSSNMHGGPYYVMRPAFAASPPRPHLDFIHLKSGLAQTPGKCSIWAGRPDGKNASQS